MLTTQPEEEEEALLRHLLAAPHPLLPASFVLLLLLLLLGGSIALLLLSFVFCLPPSFYSWLFGELDFFVFTNLHLSHSPQPSHHVLFLYFFQ